MVCVTSTVWIISWLHQMEQGSAPLGSPVSALQWHGGRYRPISATAHRLCWSEFVDPQTAIVQQYYQLFLDPASGDDVPITPRVNVSVHAQSAVATGLQLQVAPLPDPPCACVSKHDLHLRCTSRLVDVQWAVPALPYQLRLPSALTHLRRGLGRIAQSATASQACACNRVCKCRSCLSVCHDLNPCCALAVWAKLRYCGQRCERGWADGDCEGTSNHG